MKVKFTLKTKIFLLVFLSIVIIAIPIITLSYGSLKKVSRQFEEESFGNILLLIEDNISSRYQNMLSNKIMMILERKIHLQTTAFLAKSTWQNLYWIDSDKKEEVLSDWQDSLQTLNTFTGFFENGKLKSKSPYFEILAKNYYIKDFKGVSLKQMLSSHTLHPEGNFAVFTLDEEDCALLGDEMCFNGNLSLLIYFLSLDGSRVIAFASTLTDIIQNVDHSVRQIIKTMQEKFDSLAVYQNSIIAIFNGEKEIIASKGNIVPEALRDIPPHLLESAKKNKQIHYDYSKEDIPEESFFYSWGDLIFRLSYFKALDWYVLAAVPVSEIESHSETMLYTLTILASIIILLCVCVSLFVAYRIITPLQVLIHKVLGLSNADFTGFISEDEETQNKRQDVFTRFTHDLPVKRQDELGQLALAFSNMGQALEENIQSLLQTQTRVQRMQGELRAAHDIQMGILRKSAEVVRQERFACYAFLEPAKEVGGDLYDFFALPDGKIAVAIGDVSGKGVPAALFMSMTVTLIRYAMMSGLTPAEAMEKINNTLSENNPSCMFVTLFIGIFDTETGELRFANGGHCLPYVLRARPKELFELSALSGPIVGAMQDMPYNGANFTLEKGDCCFLYTDGVVEAMNEDAKLYGEERLRTLLKTWTDSSVDTVINAVYQDIIGYRGKAAPSDDITMLCFNYE